MKRMKVAGLRLGNTSSNRLPNTRRLNPVGGEMSAAPSSRQNPGGPSLSSNNKLAIRKNGSPINVPPIGVEIMSLMEGFVVSPAISHKKLPAALYRNDSQKLRPEERAKP